MCRDGTGQSSVLDDDTVLLELPEELELLPEELLLVLPEELLPVEPVLLPVLPEVLELPPVEPELLPVLPVALPLVAIPKSPPLVMARSSNVRVQFSARTEAAEML